MTGAGTDPAVSRESGPAPVASSPAPVVRMFGWLMLTVLAAYMIDNVLTVSFSLPGSSAALSGEGGILAWVQLGLYLAAAVAAAGLVRARMTRSLRDDARVVGDFNAYLIRGCFWAVFLVGIADASIAFLRVEKLLVLFVDSDTARALGRARFVGTYVHIPLVAVGFLVASVTRTLGFIWLALLIVAAELLIVLSRFVFSYEQALMGDLVRYWYAALFLFASAYTLLDEGHVRVDVFYAGMSSRTKGLVNAIGSVLLGMSTAWVIIAIGFGGKQSIINSPVANFEVTQTGGAGMFVKYQMAAFIGIFAITMSIQFVSYLFEAVADFRDEPGHVEHEPVRH